MARERLMKRGGLFVIVGRHTLLGSAERNDAAGAIRKPHHCRRADWVEPELRWRGQFFPAALQQDGGKRIGLYWQASWPQDERIWIAPLLLAAPTWDSYRRNIDPAMHAVMRYPRRVQALKRSR